MVTLRPRADFFFTVTQWELESLRHLHRVVEDHLDELLRRYWIADGTGAPTKAGPPADLALMIVEQRVPALFRNPLLAAAWALYESCLVETSEYLQEPAGSFVFSGYGGTSRPGEEMGMMGHDRSSQAFLWNGVSNIAPARPRE
jgi:hypothetical protein